MKSKIDELAQEEKNKILEMYYQNTNTITEQKAFSNLKSDIKGFGKRLKTGFQNATSSFSKTQGVAVRPSAGLQQDLTKIQSRSGDLMKTIEPIMNELNQMIGKLQGNQNAYGQGYETAQNDFMTQLNNLKTTLTNANTFLNGMTTYQANYQQPATQQTQQQSDATQQTQQPTNTTQQSQTGKLPPNSPLTAKSTPLNFTSNK